MPGKAEICGNCGEKIGQLETPFIWNNHIVCAGCHAKLSPPINYATPGAAPAASPAIHPRKAVTIEQTGKAYKAVMAIGALVAIAGGAIAAAGIPEGGLPLLLIGLLAFIAGRAAAWWGHG